MDWWVVAAYALGVVVLVDLLVMVKLLRQGRGDTTRYRVLGTVGIFIGAVVAPTCFALSDWF